jgi:hypothetical protein
MYDILTDRPHQWACLRPRFSISHLFIWTALSAAMMCWTMWEAKQSPRTVQISAPFQLTMGAFASMIDGASLGGVLVFVARRLRKIPFPVAPGEWMWFGQGLSVLFGIPIQVASLLSDQVVWTPLAETSFIGVRYLIAALPFLLPAVLYREGSLWKWFFRIALAFEVIRAGALVYLVSDRNGGFSLRLWTNINFSKDAVVATMLLAVVTRDRHRGIARDWPHCIGVLVTGMGIALAAVWNAWSLNAASEWGG